MREAGGFNDGSPVAKQRENRTKPGLICAGRTTRFRRATNVTGRINPAVVGRDDWLRGWPRFRAHLDITRKRPPGVEIELR